MKIQDPFSTGILVEESIFYLLYAAVYKTAKSGKMDQNIWQKKTDAHQNPDISRAKNNKNKRYQCFMSTADLLLRKN